MAKATSLEWDAHEYEHKERHQDWFWAAGIITIALSIACIIFGNIILGILIIVSAVSLSLFLNRPPENIRITLTDESIRRGNVLYPFDTLSSFWIDVEHPHNKIIFKSKKRLMPLIVIPISDTTPIDEVRSHLSINLKEEYHSLPLVEKILEYLGF